MAAGGMGYSASSSASSAANSNSAFNMSGLSVNYGSQAQTVPTWALLAGAVVVAVWFLRRRG